MSFSPKSKIPVVKAPATESAGILGEILQSYGFRYFSEMELHSQIAEALNREGIAFDREVRLTEKDRVDFMVGGIAVEVKVDGAKNEVLRQIHRYAQSDMVSAIVVVTDKARHLNLPCCLNGKPVVVSSLIVGGAF